MKVLPLIMMMVLSHITFGGARLTLALSAIDMRATPATVGVLVGLMGLGPMLLSVHLGRWADRSGLHRPLLTGMGVLLAGTLLPALWSTLPGLAVASVLIGSGFMLAHLTINNAVGLTSAPAHRARSFGHLAVGSSISSTLGPLLAGFAIDARGFTSTFLGLSCFTVFALALVLTRARGEARPALVPTPQPGNRVQDLLRDPPLRAVLIVSGFTTMCWDLYNFMMPVHGARVGLSASTIGFIMGGFGIASFIARFATPMVSRRFGAWQTLTVALGLAAAVYVLFPLVQAMPAFMLLSVVLGLGLGFAQPMVMTLIHSTAPAGRTGEAVGIRTVFMNTSQTLLPWCAGALGGSMGLGLVFWIVAAAAGCASLFALLRGPPATTPTPLA